MPQQPFDLSSVPRDSRRVPISAKVAFKFDRFAGFISEYSSNISPTGMFITTNEPEPPGSVLDFEFQLGDGFDLIRGKGEVVWIRAVAEGPSRPAGIGIRFLELAEGSKELIYRIVDQYVQDGGTPFDVSLRPPDPVQPIPSPSAANASPFPEIPDTGTFPAVDSSSWLPPEPQAGINQIDPIDDDFPPFMPPLPPMDEPEPPRPTVHFGGFAASAAPQRTTSVIPLAIVGLALILAAAGYVFRDTLGGMLGLGAAAEAESVAPQGPPPGRQAAAPPQETPESITPIVEEEGEATPMPEVVRRREEEAPAPAAATAPEAAPALAGPTVTAVERITFESVAGGTDIILWGNGAIRPEVYDQSHIGDPPRELIRLTGITRPFPTARVAVGTGEVKQIRVGYHSGNELHVVIDLADPGVQVTRIEAKESHLRIHLQKR
jgi:uncharacterized protein (TIGR02266 family)